MAKRTKFDNDTLNIIENNLTAIIRAIHETKNGTSLQQATHNENLNMHNVRSVLYRSLNVINNEKKPVSLKDFNNIIYTPIERLYKDIFDYGYEEWIKENFIIPSDAEESLNYVISSLTEREQQAIKLYYFDELTMDETAKILNVTRERVRQIVLRAIRKLKHPARSNILQKGLKQYNIILAEKPRIEKELTEKYLSEYKKQIIEQLKSEQEEKKEELIRQIKLEHKLEQEKQEKSISFLEKGIEELNLSVRSYNCLKRCGANTIKQAFMKTTKDFRRIRNLGMKTYEEIASAIIQYLSKQNLSMDDMILLKENLLGKKLKNGLWGDDPDET